MTLAPSIPNTTPAARQSTFDAAEAQRRAEALELAAHWLSLGAHLVPLRPRSKAILGGYGLKGRQLTTLNQTAYHLRAGANLGLVLGGLGRYACLDFEDTVLYEQWRATLGREVHTWTERTARGVHVFFQATGPEALQHCAAPHQADFLTAGVVTLAPSIHPSGVRYTVLERHPIAPMTLAEQHCLVPFTRPAIVRTQTVLKGEGERAPLPTARLNIQDLAREIRRRRRVSDEASRLGIEELKARGGGLDKWKARCPFHAGDDPDSMWLDDATGLWGCASTNCRAQQERSAHDVITLRAWADGVPLGRAIASLAHELGLTR